MNKALFNIEGRPSGIVLITGLIFIVILTLIVLALLQTGTLEERMVSNARNRQVALQAAEAVLRDAEATLFPTALPRFGSPIDPFDVSAFAAAGCNSGFCGPPSGSDPNWRTVAWSTYGRLGSATLSGVGSQPRYIVEYLGPSGGQAGGICPRLLFRLTARGSGRDAAEVFVETMFWYQPLRFADGSCG